MPINQREREIKIEYVLKLSTKLYNKQLRPLVVGFFSSGDTSD